MTQPMTISHNSQKPAWAPVFVVAISSPDPTIAPAMISPGPRRRRMPGIVCGGVSTAVDSGCSMREIPNEKKPCNHDYSHPFVGEGPGVRARCGETRSHDGTAARKLGQPSGAGAVRHAAHQPILAYDPVY